MILHQKLTSGSLLKISCSVEPEAIYSVTLKFIDLACTLNGSFTHVRFLTSYFHLLENTGLLSYVDLPNVDMFHPSIYLPTIYLSRLIHH